MLAIYSLGSSTEANFSMQQWLEIMDEEINIQRCKEL